MKCAKTVILFSLFAGALMPANVWTMGKGKNPKQNPTGQSNTQNNAKPSRFARFKKTATQKATNAKNKMSAVLNKDSGASSSDALKPKSLPKRLFNKATNWAKTKKATATTFLGAGLMATSPEYRKKCLKLLKNNPTAALATGLLGTGLVTAENFDEAQNALNYLLDKAEENPMAASVVGMLGATAVYKTGKKIFKTPQYQATMDVITPALQQNVTTATSWYNSVPNLVKEIIKGAVIQKGITTLIGDGMAAENADTQFMWFTNTIQAISQLQVPASPQLFDRLEQMAGEAHEELAQNVHELRQLYTLIRVFVDHPDRVPNTQANRQRFEYLGGQIGQLSNQIIEDSYALFYGQEDEPVNEQLEAPQQEVDPIINALNNPAFRAMAKQPLDNEDGVIFGNDMPIVRALQGLQPAGCQNNNAQGINPSMASIFADPNLGPELQGLMDNPEFAQLFEQITAGNQDAQHNRRVHAKKAVRPVKKTVKKTAHKRSVKKVAPYRNSYAKRNGFKRKKLIRLPRAFRLLAKGRRHL